MPVWFLQGGDSDDILNMQGKPTEQILVLDRPDFPGIHDKDFPKKVFGGNFYRSDDVSATAYFYLDKPSGNLPELPPPALRLQDMKEKVWSKRRK
jgi:hypothetical protein